MKRILVSLMTIAIVTVVGFAVTRAYFSDTETSTGNTLTAGTIDISVDGQNPWTNEYTQVLSDMKPSQVRWVEFPIQNVGENPVVVWKRISNVATDEGTLTEPECDAYGGSWTGSDCNGGTVRNDIDKVITYDMEVGGTVLINEDWGVTINDIKSTWVPLGRIEPDQSLTVRQSYHIQAEAGNRYQGDEMTFNIDIYAEQVGGTGPGPTTRSLVLENKDASWNPIIDGTWGLLKWAGDGPTFDFDDTLEAYGLAPSTEYSLIYYADGWPGNHPGALLGTAASDVDGDLVMTGNPDPGDMPNPADANYPGGAKIWLVKSIDYNGSNAMTAWNMSEYLFESNLIKYDDTGS